MEKLFYTAQDISEMLGYSKDKAYRIIKELNIQLKEKQVLVSENILLFLLDKVEKCYEEECRNIVKKILKEENSLRMNYFVSKTEMQGLN